MDDHAEEAGAPVPAHDAAATSRSDSPWFWPGLGVGTCVLALAAAYLIIRFSPAPGWVALGVVGALVVGLAMLGFLATRRGQAAAFVAIALLMPYLLVGVVFYAGAQRTVDEVDSFFEDDDYEYDGDRYGDDPDLDALQDSCLAGDDDACDELYLEAPVDSEYERIAEENDGDG